MTEKTVYPAIRLACVPEEIGPTVSMLCLPEYYTVVLRDYTPADNRVFGHERCDFSDGTLISGGPVHAAACTSIEPDASIRRLLLFREDIIGEACREEVLKRCTFFSYRLNEALHLSLREKATLLRCMDDIGSEIRRTTDHYRNSLLSGMVECLLNYCIRFYERQLITRCCKNERFLLQYDMLLNEYIVEGRLRTQGLPQAGFCAERLGLSEAYFSDLVEHETGKTPDAYVEFRRMEIARKKLLHTDIPIGTISAELGFSSPQSFCVLFKRINGLAPADYRLLN